MATIAIGPARYLGNIYGANINRGGSEDPGVVENAGAQSYVVGQPVHYDVESSATGTIELATASSNVVGKLAGLARKAATGVTGANAEYRAILGGDRYVMNVVGTSTTTITQALVGQDCVFDISSGHLVCQPDGSQADDKPAGVIEKLYTRANGFPDGDAIDDIAGRVIVRIVDNTGLQG